MVGVFDMLRKGYELYITYCKSLLEADAAISTWFIQYRIAMEQGQGRRVSLLLFLSLFPCAKGRRDPNFDERERSAPPLLDG